MSRVVALVVVALAGCGGESGATLDGPALPVAKAHVEKLYATPCTADAAECRAHELHESFRWVVQEPRLVSGCEPEWPELTDMPKGDCVEVEVGGRGCAPAQTAMGLTRQLVLRTVRVWLVRDGESYRPAGSGWQVAGGSDTLEPCA